MNGKLSSSRLDNILERRLLQEMHNGAKDEKVKREFAAAAAIQDVRFHLASSDLYPCL